ncbi:V-type proton ATPase 116 kDa subunit a 1-like isoform X2 [Pieris napi]|uniref:V-type proton ATPase 116 kDa subunit a 1-like isoform X2 n=1 Tax=Pieris napi TaxID=78633 RepID=UPI001FB8E3E4|nr:V-type proton ATPase 116 kDa subunit a 1-like isoform X2 [Pieris napi]
MGCMLRSDLMSLCEIFIQPECAFEVLSRLGETGNVQFLDMTPDVKAFNRSYIMELCGCVEMERKLIYMQGEMMKDNIDIPPLEVEPQALPLNEMKSLDNLLEKWESEVQDLSDNQVALLKNYLELSEMYYVLTHIGNLLGDTELTSESLFGKASSAGDGSAGHLTVMCGVVQRSRCFPFEMMLWRVSRGNIYYRQAADDAFLQDPQTGQELRKVAFLAVFQGEALSSRMEKVCNGFRVNVYSCPETIDERMDMLHKLDVRIGDLEKVIRKTKYHRCKALVTIAKQYSTWIAQIKKAKAIYHTMNMFTLDITRRCLIGQCWVPDLDLPIVKEVLETCSEEMESNVPSFISKIETSLTPPTYHRTNKFTRGFQALINAYGDSTYGELNPGLYTVITFPFLFSVMFGDVCHGMILLAFGAWMVKSEKKFLGKPSTNEIWNIFFGGRYVILLMGVFTLFTGFLYNEYFSKPITLMTPYWKNTFTREEIEKNQYITLNPVFETNSPYIFGVDPIWKLAKNKIMALNSLKMKLSIIIGIVHMIFGLSLSLFNHLYFKRHYAIYLEFIPQMLFLCGLFLWLVILMYMKWFLYSGKTKLSEMLWVMIFAKLALRDTSSMGPIKIFFIFAIWAVFTLSILVIMEGLSAFLHTLRLHWVEFMSKFYHGGGYPFKPFNFRSILSGDAKDDKEGICKRRAKTEY